LRPQLFAITAKSPRLKSLPQPRELCVDAIERFLTRSNFVIKGGNTRLRSRNPCRKVGQQFLTPIDLGESTLKADLPLGIRNGGARRLLFPGRFVCGKLLGGRIRLIEQTFRSLTFRDKLIESRPRCGRVRNDRQQGESFVHCTLR
jgi:hypothetical protein